MLFVKNPQLLPLPFKADKNPQSPSDPKMPATKPWKIMLQSPDISKAKGKPKQFFLKHKGTKEENRHKLFPSLSLQVPFKQIAPLPLQKEGKKKAV